MTAEISANKTFRLRSKPVFPVGWPPIWLLWPAVILFGFFAVPFGLLFRVSLAHMDPTLYQGSGLSLQAYRDLAQPMVTDAVLFSIGLALLVATISTAVAVPATCWVARMRRPAQVAWLVGLLSTLALSEVLITFAWQIMLSKRVGLSNILVWLHLLDAPVSLAPSFGGVVACLVYVVIPFSVLTLYPGVSRLDPALVEAATMLGASPIRAFFGVVVPILRRPIATAFVMTVVLTIGAYVAPLVLGGPKNWTIGVVISETALAGQNLPLAAAVSVLLLAVTGGLIGVISLTGRGRSSR